MLPQHPVYKNELDSECYNISLAKTQLPDDDLKRSKHVVVFLIVLCGIYINASVG